MKVKIDKEKCMGCSMCVSITDKVFVMGAGGLAEVLPDADLSIAENIDATKTAVASCPGQAISIEE